MVLKAKKAREARFGLKCRLNDDTDGYMTINMDDSHFVSIRQIKEFVKVGGGISFVGKSRDETYRWMEMVLSRFWYFSLRKKDKTAVRQYLMNVWRFPLA